MPFSFETHSTGGTAHPFLAHFVRLVHFAHLWRQKNQQDYTVSLLYKCFVVLRAEIPAQTFLILAAYARIRCAGGYWGYNSKLLCYNMGQDIQSHKTNRARNTHATGAVASLHFALCEKAGFPFVFDSQFLRSYDAIVAQKALCNNVRSALLKQKWYLQQRVYVIITGFAVL